MSEDQLQAKCYQWVYNNYPQIRGLFFSVPNGGTRNVIEAQKMKSTGLTPGIPDMVLVWPTVVGFEFKTEIGVVSPAQKKIHSAWEAVGVPVHIVRSFDNFTHIFLKHLNFIP